MFDYCQSKETNIETFIQKYKKKNRIIIADQQQEFEITEISFIDIEENLNEAQKKTVYKAFTKNKKSCFINVALFSYIFYYKQLNISNCLLFVRSNDGVAIYKDEDGNYQDANLKIDKSKCQSSVYLSPQFDI